MESDGVSSGVSHRACGFGLLSQQHILKVFPHLIAETQDVLIRPPTISAGSCRGAQTWMNPGKTAPRKNLLRCTRQIIQINTTEALLTLPRLSLQSKPTSEASS